MKLTKSVNPDKYGYSGYGNGFDAHSHFSIPNNSWGRNVTTFGGDNSFSVHVDNKKKNISVFGEGPTQELDDLTITAEAKYSINVTESKQDLC